MYIYNMYILSVTPQLLPAELVPLRLRGSRGSRCSRRSRASLCSSTSAWAWPAPCPVPCLEPTRHGS